MYYGWYNERSRVEELLTPASRNAVTTEKRNERGMETEAFPAYSIPSSDATGSFLRLGQQSPSKYPINRSPLTSSPDRSLRGGPQERQELGCSISPLRGFDGMIRRSSLAEVEKELSFALTQFRELTLELTEVRRLDKAHAKASMMKSRAEDLDLTLTATKGGNAPLMAFPTLPNAELRGERCTLQVAYRTLEQAAERLSREAGKYEQDVVRGRTAVAEVEKDLIITQTRVRELEWRLEKATKEGAALKLGNEELQATVTSLREELSSSHTLKVQTTLSLDDMTHMKNDLERRLETTQAEAGMHERRAADFDSKLAQTTRSLSTLSTANVDLKGEIMRLKGDCTSKEEELSQCRSKILGFQQEISALQSLVVDWEGTARGRALGLHASESALKEVTDRNLREYFDLKQAYEAVHAGQMAELNRLKVSVHADAVELIRSIEGALRDVGELSDALLTADAEMEVMKLSKIVAAQHLQAQTERYQMENHSLRESIDSLRESMRWYAEDAAVSGSQIAEIEAAHARLSSLLQLLQQHMAPAGAELASKNQLVHQYAAEISGLKARLAPVQADAEKKAARVARLEALQADTRTQVRALQLRCASANDECRRAQAEMKHLQTLAAQEVAMQLEQHVTRAAHSEQEAREQQQTISVLTAEIKELKMQIACLTHELELAVGDLEVEARQTQRFTKSFLDLSRRFSSQSNSM